MSGWKQWSGTDFFEDYLLPTNGQTKNPLWEITGIPYLARRSPLFSVQPTLDAGKGIVSACRQRMQGALLTGTLHLYAGAQCLGFSLGAAETGNGKLLTLAAGGLVINAYCALIQGDVAQRCKKVLRRADRRRAERHRVLERKHAS
ncbi:MAG TPA: hypothetical protein DEB30_01520 [Candidatus Peribacter riflensis]|uniref:Uncharacterized protein n=1 Tax=Candidatus Peribacter riflensis TaxID=1735162 RepID=A0A0S1STS5_9BACT|nr:MAG: hypothetical protein PeribacterA2_1073 [Candidatus Peribacter riflensis]OGJ77953.1 MAG: hypothetical protein A2398_01525 [Candidatus Peribacteria bacterium RIFOXYB1_FULL_57_12]ALM11532.1 MAG: hypothetical protein PeribacterB2_1075 [Candidatus Peribacter riflensis]ALM12634.1 MAG: hypothetical protein PeribacterC2_1074 [Candidatus Peribacter riflensis]ALM13735.1 MAG: hypothetical protein PeribacterD1_1073 [Candidatus Peribacter riflensis]